MLVLATSLRLAPDHGLFFESARILDVVESAEGEKLPQE